MDKKDKAINILIVVIGTILVLPLLILIDIFAVVYITYSNIRCRSTVKTWFKDIVDILSVTFQTSKIRIEQILNGQEI